MSKKNELVKVCGDILHETDKAYLFRPDLKNVQAWIPKSQCQWDDDDNALEMPQWLAEEKELV